MIINASCGGAALNFKVMSVPSVDSLPGTAKVNTIAVITNTDISGWTFSSGSIPNGSIVEAAGTVLGTISGRTYTKTNSGKAAWAFVYNGTYTGVMLVSTDKNACTYSTSGDHVSTVQAADSFVYNGETYWYSRGSWMQGDYTASVSPSFAASYNKAAETLAYLFSLAEEGHVWISTGTTSRVAFNALKKNGILICPMAAKQYIDGAWVSVSAKTYQRGKWVDWTVFAFNNGDLCEGITGGWEATDRNWYDYGQVMATMRVENGLLIVESYFDRDSNNFGGTVQTKNKIDMTPFSTVVFNVKDCGLLNSSAGYGLVGKYRLGVTSDVTSKAYTMDAFVDLEENGVNREVAVDVSNINKPCAVAINPTSKGKGGSTAYVSLEWIALTQ